MPVFDFNNTPEPDAVPECTYTTFASDENVSSADAARIYGKNMARIRGMDQLARAAGRLIQNEIRELGD